MALVLDTSVLLGAIDAADPDHGPCGSLISESDEPLIVPILVLSELDYWCHKRLTADVWMQFLDDVLNGAYIVEVPSHDDLSRCRDLQRTYSDLEVGIVDASVLALVERRGEHRVATLDHRHFGAMRPRHVEALELLPG